MTLDSSFIYYRSKLIIVIRRNSSNSFLETKGQTYLFDRLESFILFFSRLIRISIMYKHKQYIQIIGNFCTKRELVSKKTQSIDSRDIITRKSLHTFLVFNKFYEFQFSFKILFRIYNISFRKNVYHLHITFSRSSTKITPDIF